MKRLLKTILSISLVVFAFLLLNNNKYEIKEFSSTINSKIFRDPQEVTYINKIEINIDHTKAKLSPIYTYNQASYVFESNWEFPENSHLSKGNNNVYFYYCPSSTLCELAETSRSYQDHVNGDRYHWVNFEIYTANCQQGADYCQYDFDEEHLDDIEVWVDGVKRDDAIVTNYNDYWHSVDAYFPIDAYRDPVVADIKVLSDSSYIQKGTTTDFTADINYYGEEAKDITWSILDTESANTTISDTGHLTVAADETAYSIKVRATSTYDNNVYGEKTMYIIDEPLSITSVTIDKRDSVVVYGGIQSFSASVNGTANKDVTWSISGANSVNTHVDADGLLTVGADETATSITLTATSVFDNTKYDSVTVTVREKEYITKIEITYDPEVVIFSNKTTYLAAKSVLRNNWSLPENAGYDKGNDNIWFDYCETAERCTEDFIGGYSENMHTDKYTWVDFEIFAKPSGTSNSLNQIYDFDSNHLDDIEIWVNGVKRDDAMIKGYNSSWREVDVFVPITVTDGKLNQDLHFSYAEYSASYGDTEERNYLNHRAGDGTITYTSSDETIATVDNDGYLTFNKIGTCTITAHASETNDYKATDKSYTLTVYPRSIYPTIDGYDYYQYYSGTQITPSITVTYNDITLVEDVDYTVSYGDNLNIGYGQIYIDPVEGSNYTFSTRSANIYINKKTIQNENISISPSSVNYTGEPIEVEITVTVDGRILTEDVDYTVNYSGNTTVGTAYIYISGTNNYNGYEYVTFEITNPPEYEKGDINMDGAIGLSDVIKLLKIYLGIEVPTSEETDLGDMNDDGAISLSDVILLLKTYLGIA